MAHGDRACKRVERQSCGSIGMLGFVCVLPEQSSPVPLSKTHDPPIGAASGLPLSMLNGGSSV